MSSTEAARPRWYASTLLIALAGSVLLWASLPPFALGWLGWLALVPWLLLVRVGELPGRRPYRALYFAGLVFWLLSLHFLRLPHPATCLGWFALAAYLAVYLPVFVGLARVAVHRVRLPLWLAAPLVWTGLELARAHLLTGFLMGSLAHTQVDWTAVIQISDLFGEYGVDFLMMLVAACVTEALWVAGFSLRTQDSRVYSAIRDAQTEVNQRSSAQRLMAGVLKLIPAVVALGAALIYGHWRISQGQHAAAEAGGHRLGPRVAIIQGNSLAEWKLDPNRERQIMDEYYQLSQRAVAEARGTGEGRPVDLVVWPETMFRVPLVTFGAGYKPPAGATRTLDEVTDWGPKELSALVSRLGTPVLVGVDRAHYPTGTGDEELPPMRFNSAVLVGRDGKVIGTYDKMHLVMFGEYIPLAGMMPFLYRWTPLTGGIGAGEEPVALSLDHVYCFVPNICFESVIPQVIRRQISALEKTGNVPDTLVNLTNDAWYWGSSELDMHLACDVFRAVENRLPLVVAANGGLSAWIDQFGRVRAKSPRQQGDVIIADIEPSTLRSRYVQFGDWFAGICLTICILLAIAEWRGRRLIPSRAPNPASLDPSP